MWRVEREEQGRVKEINENASNSGRVMDISQRFSLLFQGGDELVENKKIKRDFLNQWRPTTSSCLVERERESKSSFFIGEKRIDGCLPKFPFFFFSFLFFLVGKNKLLCLVMFDSLRCVGNIYHAVSLLFILISSLEPLMAAIILKDFFHSIFKRIHLENLLLLLSS